MATKHKIGTTLPTARSASHPHSPDQNGNASMSGRAHRQPNVLKQGPAHAFGSPTGRMTPVNKPPAKGRPSAYKPNGGLYTPHVSSNSRNPGAPKPGAR